MVKLVARIPAEQIQTVSRWALPEINPDATKNQKVFKLTGGSVSNKKNVVSKRKVPLKKNANTEDLVATSTHVQEPDVIPPDLAQSLKSSTDLREHEDTKSVVSNNNEVSLADKNAAENEIAEKETTDNAVIEDSGYEAGFKEGEAAGFAQGEVKGFEAGESAGRESGAKKVQAELTQTFSAEVASQQAVMASLLSALKLVPDRSPAIETALISLITRVAEVVVLSELKSNPELINRLVLSALDALPHGVKKIQISVNPSNLEFLQENFTDRNFEIEYVKDINLSIGSCKINSDTSVVDAMLSDRIHASLMQVFSTEEPKVTDEAALINVTDKMHD